ncbi:hypothetical protein D6C91_00538 [Aureobasidium pullulans]|uniref:DUF2423 domain-containing protein n=1 Tax=Aureobasidium pullulans TaxID=5580 RepID=A0A4S9U2F0_AURPU|nr:hypothetical protein D6D15_01664 [Aureobasidium pullulans]THZ32139.1 hypothetical protein D6C91_00538 [Aureobasidium pullulans]
MHEKNIQGATIGSIVLEEQASVRVGKHLSAFWKNVTVREEVTTKTSQASVLVRTAIAKSVEHQRGAAEQEQQAWKPLHLTPRVICSWFHASAESPDPVRRTLQLPFNSRPIDFSARLSDCPPTRFLVPSQENLSLSFTAIFHTTTPSTHAKMGKGLRSSVNKTNNRKLKKNVFGPVETARTERLSQKLMELASQPKPPKSEMEVEESGGKNFCPRDTPSLKLTPPCADSKQAESEAKAANANGALNALAIPVPKSLAHQCPATAAASMNMLTPPPTPPLDISDFSKPSIRSAHRHYADEQLFFHLLGAEKRAKEDKRNRIAKKQKRKVINQMTFKKNPRTGKK